MLKFKSFLLMLALSFCGYANATLILDFESLEETNSSVNSHGFEYTEDGFLLTNLSSLEFATFGTLESRYTGSTALFNNTVGGITQLTRVGGGVFDLISIDLSELNAASVASVTFTRDGGFSQTFTLDGILGPQTFLFDSNFLGSSSVSFTQVSPFHQFDNITILENSVGSPNTVSEPSISIILGLGLICIAIRRKRSS